MCAENILSWLIINETEQQIKTDYNITSGLSHKMCARNIFNIHCEPKKQHTTLACSFAIQSYPTTPYKCCYTTLWNMCSKNWHTKAEWSKLQCKTPLLKNVKTLILYSLVILAKRLRLSLVFWHVFHKIVCISNMGYLICLFIARLLLVFQWQN